MNILYHTYGKVHSTKGGTERTTITVANALTKYYGAKCFSIYEDPADSPKEDCFVEEILWKPEKTVEANKQFLRNIIVSKKIDCVIIQGAFIHVPRFRVAIEGLKCKLIFAHHFEPGWESIFGSFKYLSSNRPSNIIDFIRWIKCIVLYPLSKNKKERILSKSYHDAYVSADSVVLLCDSFKKAFSQIAEIRDLSKYVIIPNGLSFEYNDKINLDQKLKQVLIVSRLDESCKRLSLALRIWKQVKKDAKFKEWSLSIVGHGNDLHLYEKIISQEQIPDVTLEGRQNPINYYKEASLFLMTSRSESWGLTLTEAQQFGVVPIAFDTYASLHEIIKSEENGIIVPEGDIDGYIMNLKRLMSDISMRKRLAENAFKSVDCFTQEAIARKWWNLLIKK